LKNSGKKFTDKTEALGLEKTTGWWYSIVADDFDKDGDLDLVAGNLGLNYKYQADPEETFDVYANDYDKNGKLDIVLGYYQDGIQYPLRGKQCSSDYNDDGNLDILVGGNMYGSEVETPRNDASYGCLLLGDGTGQFSPLSVTESGVFIKGDTKGLDKIATKNGLFIIAANNSEQPTLLKLN